MDQLQVAIIVLNGRTFDVAAEVLRDPAGSEVPLRPQSFAVLKYMTVNADRVVTKDELMAAVWPDVAVTENSLVQCIHEIRRALGDESQSILKTVARRGYRLVVRETHTLIDTERATTTRLNVQTRQLRAWRHPALFAAVFLIVAVLGVSFWQTHEEEQSVVPPSIAVLPFNYESDDKQQSLLAAGFTEDVVTDLTRFRDLEVIAQNSTNMYTAEPHDIKRIGRDLNVRYVLEGSIRRQGTQLRVTAQLVDALSATRIWAERWDRPIADIFAIQTELSQELAGKVGGFSGTVLAADQAAAMRKRPGNLTAYDLYLTGIDAKNREDEASVREAIELFKRSIEIDPHFARAWTMLGSAYAISTQWANDVDETHRLYEAAVTRAVELDPLDAEAHAALGFALARHSHPERAKAEFDEALRLNPNSADVLTRYSYWAASLGLPKKGADMAKQALRLNPAAPPSALRFMRGAFIAADKYQKALTVHNRLPRVKYIDPDYIDGAIILAMLDRSDEAKALVAEGTKKYPDLTIESWTGTSDWGEADRAKAVGQMRKAGFAACASATAVEQEKIVFRLAECVQADAATP
jgi:TolB-like protein/DNA-binding winged helix-turn-helix (wHTH) protein/tetratricopeptide (TPR) repeat protein